MYSLVFQLSEVLVEMGSNLMQVDDKILFQAQKDQKACSTVVCSLETLAWPQLHPNAQDLSMVGDTLGFTWSFWESSVSVKEIVIEFILPECTAVQP